VGVKSVNWKMKDAKIFLKNFLIVCSLVYRRNDEKQKAVFASSDCKYS